MPGKKNTSTRIGSNRAELLMEPAHGSSELIMGLLLGIHEHTTPRRVPGKTPSDRHIEVCARLDEKFTTANLLRAPLPSDLIDIKSIDTTRHGIVDTDDIDDAKVDVDTFLDGCISTTKCVVLPCEAEFDQSFCRWHSTDRYAVPHLKNEVIIFTGIQVVVSEGCACIEYDCGCATRTCVTFCDPPITFEKVCVSEPVKAAHIIYSLLGYIGAVRYLLKLYPQVFSLERIVILHKSRKQMFEYCINCFTIQHCPAHLCERCSELDEGKQLYRTINHSVDDENHMEMVKTIYRKHLGEKIRSTYYQKPRAKNR